MKKILSTLLTVTMMAGTASAMALTPEQVNKSYCNPLNLDYVDVYAGHTDLSAEFNMPSVEGANKILATEVWDAATGRTMVRQGGGMKLEENNFRTTADIFVYQISDGTYVMHASGSMQNNDTYGGCWTSTDYINWEYHEMNRCVTAPTFVQIGDTYYLCGNGSEVLKSDSPIGPWEPMGKFQMPDGSEKGFSDVNFFLDDDGRLYLSYSIGSPIMACELDASNPTKVLTEPVCIWYNDGRNTYERFGSDNSNAIAAYTEGSQIFKYNGTYYLQVATNGTESITYCIAVKKSTEGPLSGWEYQENNPVAFNTSNFIPAAGHGSFTVDNNNNLVLFYTQVIGYENNYDRRVGMDICWLDDNGDIHVNITDHPQLAPDLVEDPANASGDLGLAQLCSIGTGYWASSYAPGRNPWYAYDQNGSTWWQPAEDDTAPVYYQSLAGVYDVYAIQLNWKEIGNDFDRYNAKQFTLEYIDLETGEFKMLYDASNETVGRAVDYIRIPEGVRTIGIRLNILGTTENVPVGVSGMRVFGENYTMGEEHHRWENEYNK